MTSLGALAAHGSFPPTAESIAAARRLVRTTLANWALGDVAGDALLIASELCTNAVIHAGTEFTISCTHLGGAIRLAIRDGYPGRTLPTAVIAPGEARTSGRGLLLCAALSSSWGVDYDKTGKLVWCQLDLPGAEHPAPAPDRPVLLAAVILDPTGHIRDWTAPATELLGWTPDQVIGRPFTALATDRRVIDTESALAPATTPVPHPGTAPSPADRTEPTNTPNPTHPATTGGGTGAGVGGDGDVGGRRWAGATDLLVLDAGGQRIPLQARFVPVGSEQPTVVLLAPAGDPWAFVLASQPAPAAPDRSGDALAAFDSDRVPAHELPQRAAEACCDYLGGDAAYLMLVNENGDLQVAGATGLGEDVHGYTEPTEDVLRASPERIPQVVAELADTANAPPPLLAAGMHAVVSVPVLVDGRLIGQLTVASAVPGQFGPEDAVRMHLAAAQLGRPLDRARITELERRRRGWLSYLAEASDLLSGTLDPQATVAVLAQLLVPRLATWCGVRMTDERGRPRLAYVWHADEPMLDALRVMLDSGTEGSADDEFTLPDRLAPTTNQVAPTPNRATPAETLGAPAENRAASSVNRPGPAETRATPAENRATAAASRATPTTSRATPAENRVAPAETRATPAENRAASAENRATPAENRTARTENHAAPTETRAAPTENRGASAENRSAYGADPAADAPAPTEADMRRIRSGPLATVALTARGRRLGTVLIGREPGERFGRDTLGLAEEICRRAALILDNALLYSDNLATSRALQASLLPAQLPHVKQLDVGVAYQAKGEGHDVGGDFYDLYATEPDCWRFTIGDVCGSGPAAAAITGLARNALRILGRQGLPLPAVLAELNSLILDESVGSRFLTALHGEIRPAEGGGVRLRLVAAGHPTPYLVDADHPPAPVTKPQPLLGVLSQVAYHEQELTLVPGQVLVCLTDGVLERRDGERMLGEHDLAAVLARTAGVSAGAAAAQVQQAVLEYSSEPAKDDFAILVLRAV